MRLYNSLSQKKEDFVPINPPNVNLYCCGPTVYDYLHIGNFRGPVVFNLLYNYLETKGYTVNFVYNYTDVDDKIIARAQEKGISPRELAKTYTEEFEKDFGSLGLRPHTHNPRATAYIEPMITFISNLLEKGAAYAVGGEVFFDVSKCQDYGKLSGQKIENRQSGSRIEVDERKKSDVDFTLWKPAKEGEESWDSPWGKGRPGWHTECCVMVSDLLGNEIDIHCGGLDLKFPHHENEIAQLETYSGKTMARFWLHNNMLNFSGAKMSKSLGNLISLREFLQGHPPEVYKCLILGSHYRSVLDFSEKSIAETIKSLSRIYSCLALAEDILEQGQLKDMKAAMVPVEKAFQKTVEQFLQGAEKGLDDDLNTPVVFAQIYEICRHFNQKIRRGMKVNQNAVSICQQFKDALRKIGSWMSLFGNPAAAFLLQLDDYLLKDMGHTRQEIDSIVMQRVEARNAKDFEKSDTLRDQLSSMGINVQDLPSGTYWEVAK